MTDETKRVAREPMQKLALSPSTDELWDSVERSLDDARKAFPVLSTMLKHAKDCNGRPVDLRAGAVVADEMIGNVGYAHKAIRALRKNTPPSDRERRLHEALREIAIVIKQMLLNQGQLYCECALCNTEWRNDESERHAPGCLAAPLPQEGE